MDQTIDILGLCDDNVGYSKNNDVENQRNSLLENKWTTNGLEGSKSEFPDDKKPLVHDVKIQSLPLLAMPKTQMEWLRLSGILGAIFVSIVILGVIFANRTKGKCQ